MDHLRKTSGACGNGFSNPHTKVARLDDRRVNARRMNACGFLPDDDERARKWAQMHELRTALVRLVGTEEELTLLLRVAEQEVTLRGIADQTFRDASVLCRRFPKYVEQLKRKAMADAEIWTVISKYLDDGHMGSYATE